jgi:hypothetical protein
MGLLDDAQEYARRSGRNLGGLLDWLGGGAVAGAEPIMALMRGDAADQPFLPTADSGGRIGAVASAVGSTVMPAKAPAGALGAGPVMRGTKLDMAPEARAARAAEQGYTVDAYHGTRADFDQFAGRNRYGQAQPQYFALADEPGAASYASSYAEGGRVIPVKLNMDRVLDARKPDDLAALRTVIDNDWQLGRDGADEFIKRKFKDGLPGWGDDNLFRALDEAGYLGVVLRERPDLTSVAMWEPSNIRSRFAAFDPARSGEADLLASRVPTSGLLSQPTLDDLKDRL